MSFPVELKVTLDADQVEPALERLGLDRAGQRRTIGFLEDLRSGRGELPLLDAGIVLRVRENEGDEDDATVKLRPCRLTSLRERWRHDDDVRIEQDWAGARHVLAASYVSDRPRGRVAAVRSGDDPVRRLFDHDQERFLADAAPGVAADLDELTLLPFVDALRWDEVEVDGVDPPLVAERWTVDELDFLELSLRVETDDGAEAAQPALEDGLDRLGPAVPVDQETKTRRVLRHLARG